MVTLQSNNITETSSSGMTLSATYTKFGGLQPKVHRLFEWITGNFLSTSYYNYWSWTSLYGNYTNKTVWIKFGTSTQIYMTGVKMNILLTSPLIDQQQPLMSTVQGFKAGSKFSYAFSHNLAIDQNAYGSDGAGYCLYGLYVIDLYLYNSGSSGSNFLFSYNGNQISGLTYN